MKRGVQIVAGILIFAGGIFFLQGMRVLPSVLMYGKPEWIVIGAGMVVAGGAMLVIQNRRAK